MAARPRLTSKNFVSPNLDLVSCLRHRLLLPFILQVISNEKKHSFKLLCWNVNEKFTIDRAGYQSKQQQGKNTLQVFFVLFTRPPSPSGICGTLPPSLLLLTTTAKKKTLFAGIHVSSREHWAADCLHACAKCDCNLRVERARKTPYSRS